MFSYRNIAIAVVVVLVAIVGYFTVLKPKKVEVAPAKPAVTAPAKPAEPVKK
jgi:hypothetical protein